MNFASVQKENITLIGNGKTSAMKIPTPNCLQNNLLHKRIGIKSVTIDTSSIPRFIPRLIDWSQFSYSSGATVDNLVFPTGGALNILLVAMNFLGYFVVLRKNDNTRACQSFVEYGNPNNLDQPQYLSTTMETMISRQAQINFTPFYFMYDFSDFLEYVSTAIDHAFETLEPVTPYNPSYFVYDAATKTFELMVDVNIITNYHLEFDDALFKLFRFNSKKINNVGTSTGDGLPAFYYPTNRIRFQPFVKYIGTDPYYNATCEVKNNIFPYNTFIIECQSLPLQYFNFRSTKDTTNNCDNSFQSLKVWKKEFNSMNMDENLYDKSTDIADDANNFTSNTLGGQAFLTFRLILKTPDDIFIDWILRENEKIDAILFIYDVI